MPSDKAMFNELERVIKEKPYFEQRLPDLRVWDQRQRLAQLYKQHREESKNAYSS